MFILILLVCKRLTYSMFRNEICDIREELQMGENFTLESQYPLLCVYFVAMVNVRVSIYIDDSLYNELDEFSDITGIDCGNHRARLVFQCTSDYGSIRLSAVVFPAECESHRLLLSFPFTNLVFSSKSMNDDYRLTHHQHICIWPATPAVHTVNLTMYTEKEFDVLTVWTKHGVTRAFSGHVTDTFASRDGLEFFMWRSDATGLSDNFSIRIETLVEESFPMFRTVIRGGQSNDVSLLFTRSDDPMPTIPKPHVFELENLLPILYVVTGIIVIGTVFVVVWSIREARAYSSPSTDEGDLQFETTQGYAPAADELPRPFLPYKYADKIQP